VHAVLSFGKNNVIFPRMNFRRKKISMKEQLEEAIKEIGGEPLRGSGFEPETPEEGFSEIPLLRTSQAPRPGRISIRNEPKVLGRHADSSN
jgi:hypothetical protein